MSRERGNAAFQRAAYDEAVREYTDALRGETDAVAHVGQRRLHECREGTVLANRAASYAALQKHDDARRDAVAATKLRPDYAKAWYRAAAAALALGDRKAAARYAQRAAALAPADKATRLLVAKCASGLGTLYGDRGDWALEKGASDETRAQRDAKVMIERMKSIAQGSGDKGGLGVDAVFRKLLDARTFRETVFPGVSAANFDRESCDDPLPSTLADFLAVPEYACAMERTWPRVEAKARAVMVGAQKRGLAEGGEVMDSATEAELWPQVLSEAFARCIAPEVRRIAQEKHAKRLDDLSKAPRTRPDGAVMDVRLDSSVAAALSLLDAPLHGRGVACVIDDFLGDDWASLVSDDAARLVAESSTSSGALRRLAPYPAPESAAEPRGRMAWLDAGDLDDDFPALAELSKRLGALAVALARAVEAAAARDDDGAASSETEAVASNAHNVVGLLGGAAAPLKLNALVSASHGRLLRVLGVDDVVSAMCDAADEARPPCISCLYLVGDGQATAHLDLDSGADVDLDATERRPPARGGDVVLYRAGAALETVRHVCDRIVLWRSDLVSHSRTRIECGQRISVGQWVYAA
ncbi:hypothetical protein M885DRAFT_619030 [Pelagophyceae sp. CCMP2097]|nr:hypothetical protein M885DRAFT_619030 [Pelagophyceae sp. CCMP2097]